MTERKPAGMSFRTWVDSQISASIERGEFEHLSGAGKPLRDLDREQTAYDWALAKARREGVDTAAMLPPGLALRRERDELPARAARLAAEAEVVALAEDYNARVEAFWRRPQESRWSPVPGLADVEALVAGWRENRPQEPPAEPPPPARPAAARRRFRLRHLRRWDEPLVRLWRRGRRGERARVPAGPAEKGADMTEVPGTGRDQARENVAEETPLVPESVEGADEDAARPRGDEGVTGDDVKPTPGSTEPVT